MSKIGFSRIRESKAFYTVFALLLSFLVGALFLLVIGYNPFSVYKIVLDGSVGSLYSIFKSLAKATPLVFTGLSVFFADRAGLFNIGAEGQLLIGGVTSGIFGHIFASSGMNPLISIILCLALSFFAGALWGLIPGWLKAYFGANEFIVSMMLNYIAASLCEYLVTYPFRGPGVTAKTNQMPDGYLLPRLAQGTQFNLGFFIALLAIILVFLFFKYASKGLEICTMGKSQLAARAAGVDIRKQTLFVFFVAGGLAALAGATEVLGIHGFFVSDLSPGYGFDGIAVSVLAQGNTFGVLLSSLLFGALRAGGSRLDLKSKVPSEFIVVLQAVVIVFVATPRLIEKFLKRKEAKKNA